jgi:hypothetical protein
VSDNAIQGTMRLLLTDDSRVGAPSALLC